MNNSSIVKAQPRTLVVVLNYNGIALLRDHLRSVVKSVQGVADVLFVDNGSSDDSVAYVRKTFPEVKVHIIVTNIGFGRANNAAMRAYPDYDYYLILNNDMEPTSGWLQTLVRTVQTDPKIGAVGPKVLYRKKRDGKAIINSAGGVLDKFDRGFDRYEGCEDSPKYNRVEDVDWLTGGAVLFRKEMVDETAGFDERFFIYYEDVDLCLRMRELGWRVVYDGRSTLVHDHMGTMKAWNSRRIMVMSNKNRLKSIARRRGILHAVLEGIRSAFEYVIFTVYSKVTGTTYRDMITKGLYECV